MHIIITQDAMCIVVLCVKCCGSFQEAFRCSKKIREEFIENRASKAEI